jgi:hypothetical protein
MLKLGSSLVADGVVAVAAAAAVVAVAVAVLEFYCSDDEE